MKTIKILAVGCLGATVVVFNSCEPVSLPEPPPAPPAEKTPSQPRSTWSNEAAFEQIRTKGGFPKLVSSSFEVVMLDSPLGKELIRLIKEGYMERGNYMDGCGINEKGKDLVKSCHVNNSLKRFETVWLYTHVVDVDPAADKAASINNIYKLLAT